MPTRNHGLTTLSFAGSTGKGGSVNLWLPHDGADPRAYNAEGRRRADELLQMMRQEDMPFLFGHIIGAMIAAGAYGALEIGFCQRVAEFALSGDIPLMQSEPPARQAPVLTLVK